MSTLKSIANKVTNCGGSKANTGKLGCLQLFGTPLSLILTKKGYSIPANTNFTVEFLQAEVQAGNLIPVMEASSFEDLSAEDAMSTNAAGIERLNLQGLPKYKFMYEEGHEFYRQMSYLTSYKSKGAILIDDAGRWLFGVNDNGDYVGMTAGQILAEPRKTKVQGGDAESRALSIQFIDRVQWDMDYMIAERSSIGISADDVPAVNGVNLSFTQTPADTDTDVKVKAVLASDNSSLVEGVTDATDWSIWVDGTRTAVTGAVEDSPGNYTLTVAALATGQEVSVSLFDDTANRDIIISNDVLMRSNENADGTVII